MPSGKRLVDVLDEQPEDINWMIDKLLKLKARITSHNPRLNEKVTDDLDWVEGQINKINGGGNIYKMQMLKANELWRRYKQGVASLLGMGIHNGQGLGIFGWWVASG